MRVVWSILCEDFAQDKTTNKLSVFNVIESWRLLSEPPASIAPDATSMVLQPFHLLALITRSEPSVGERGVARVSVIDPQSGTRRLSEIEVNLVDFTTYRIWVRNLGLRITSAGIYNFTVECQSGTLESEEWGPAFEVPLLVSLAESGSASPNSS